MIRRKPWTYIARTDGIKPVPLKWNFRTKQLDKHRNAFLYKARLVLRWDKKGEYVDCDPDEIYAPVATYKRISIMVLISASEYLILEGADVDNSYLYGKLGIPIIREQPKHSSGNVAQPGMVCELCISLYGTKKAGRIWRSVIHKVWIQGVTYTTYICISFNVDILLSSCCLCLTMSTSQRMMPIFWKRPKKRWLRLITWSLYGELENFPSLGYFKQPSRHIG